MSAFDPKQTLGTMLHRCHSRSEHRQPRSRVERSAAPRGRSSATAAFPAHWLST